MSGWPAVTCATPNRTCASTWSNPSPWSARKINLSRNRQAQKHVGPRPLDRLVGPSAVRRLAMKSRNRKAAQPRTQAAMNFDTPANPPNDLKAAIQHELKKSEDIFPDAAS